MAYTKIVLEDEILAPTCPTTPTWPIGLINYFPSRHARARTPTRCREHRLHREIIATVVVNEFVNQSGHHLLPPAVRRRPGPAPADVIRAQIAARAIFGAGRARRGDPRRWIIRSTPQVQTELRMEVRTLVERATRWLVNNRRRPIDIGAAVEQLAAGVQAGAAGAARRC